MATTVVEHLAGGAPAGHRHPLDIVAGGGFEHGGDVGVTVQAGGDHVIEPGSGDLGEVVLGDQTTVGDERDAADPEPGLQIVEHGRHRGASAVLPANTRCAIGIPSPVTSSPIITCGRSRRRSRL